MKGALWTAALAFTCYIASPATAETAGDRMFERLKALAGDWEGTFKWSGARVSSGSMTARYYVTGYGSAVVEDLLMGGDKPSMTSVYHLGGADLRMTHFCGARNQPRFKAARIDPVNGEADFAFVDITYSGPTTSAHVNAASLRIEDDDHVHIQFVFDKGEKRAVEDISLSRVKGTSS